MASLPSGWLQPDWPAPAGVRAACTTRVGGRSCGVWQGLNLGDHVGDDPAAVRANRAEVDAAINARPVFLRQVHGVAVARLDAGTPQGTEADACVTTQRGVACTVMVADCLPVLLAHDSGRAVGGAHAGWRGLAGGVIESALVALGEAVGESPAQAARNTLAWLGPCIGPREFEVGEDVRQAFVAADPHAAAAFATLGGGKYLADLPILARQRLAAAGVSGVWGNDGSDDWCTVRRPSRFFSHRRDGVSGRFAALVWLA
ncbi:MAG: peptidoglycan editing factor PgeF [Burkholderiaceae bacterium]|nr:peptidoglycan editing factor PgeF [Burkholderiaceae bacterium]